MGGFNLSYLHIGLAYDVDASLGGYLVTIGAAEEVPLVPAIALDDHDALPPVFGGITFASSQDRVADHPRRRLPRRHKHR